MDKVLSHSVIADEVVSCTPIYQNKYHKHNITKATTVSDITGWTTGTSLPTSLFSPQAIVTKNRVYLLGGYNGSDNIETVYTAPINADGTLGTWTTGTSLPIAIGSAQAIVTKNRVYLLGGYSSSLTTLATVYTAPINADGTLGAWTTGASLPGGLRSGQSIVTKNRVYLLGGSNNTGPISTVYTAPINADGTLGTWTTETSLPAAMFAFQAIVTKNRVYLLGGYTTTYSSTVYTAPINADGTLGTWVTGTSLPITNHNHLTIMTKGRVFMISGGNATGTLATVYTAPINADGTLGAWTTGASLPGGLRGGQSIVTKNRVYLLGGYTTVYSSIVYTAPFADGWEITENSYLVCEENL